MMVNKLMRYNLVKFRKQLEEELGMDVDISIVEIDGSFVNPPFTPLK